MSYHIKYVDVPHYLSTRQVAECEHIEEMHELGGGCYAKTYGSDRTPYVVKIFRCTDLGYLTLLKVREQLGIFNNRFLPRIHKVIIYRQLDEDGKVEDDRSYHTGVVKMERLEHGRSEEDYRGRFYKLCRKLASRIQYPDYYVNKEDFFQKPEFEEAAALIRLAYEEAEKEGGDDFSIFYDIHSSNIMLRKGRVVFTDPLA